MKTIFILCGLLLVSAAAIFFFTRSRTDHHGNDFQGFPVVEIAPLVDRPADFLIGVAYGQTTQPNRKVLVGRNLGIAIYRILNQIADQ